MVLSTHLSFARPSSLRWTPNRFSRGAEVPVESTSDPQQPRAATASSSSPAGSDASARKTTTTFSAITDIFTVFYFGCDQLAKIGSRTHGDGKSWQVKLHFDS